MSPTRTTPIAHESVWVGKRIALATSAAVLIAGAVVTWHLPATPASVDAPDAPRTFDDAPTATPFAILPLPQHADFDPTQAGIGRRLFHDVRLSGDGSVSCASCHDLDEGGADHRALSIGIHGAAGTLNAPSVFNTSFNFKQFWDGRALTLEDQVEGPLTSTTEMGGNWNTILAVVRADPDYGAAFRSAFSDGVSRPNVKRALASYMRSLVTPDAPLDRYLRGEHAALSDEEQRGFQLFQDLGCTNCHQGVNIGGNMFQTMGRMGDYFADRGNVSSADYGRFNVTGNERDRFKFKVPSLRNVALTAPYLHDGRAATLEQAVTIMARYQLGVELQSEETRLLVAFLRTLTGVFREAS